MRHDHESGLGTDVTSLLDRWRFELPGVEPEPPPSTWRRLKKLWIAFGERIGRVTSVLLLSAVYLTLFGIGALVARIMRADPLRMKAPSRESYWRPKNQEPPTLESARRQF